MSDTSNTSGMSRRSLLGYSGTAAAGAVLTGAGAGSALAAEGTATEANQAGAAQTASQSAASFPPGTEFKGQVRLPGYDGELSITFSVSVMDAAPSHDVTPLDIANALNQLAQQRGWAPITFYGTPAPAPLTA